METGGEVRLAEIFVGLREPRHTKKLGHNLVEMLVVAVCSVLVGADDFVETEEWPNEKVDSLRQYLALANGISSHHRFGRVFAALDAEAFAADFRRWVSGLLPVLGKDEVIQPPKVGVRQRHLASFHRSNASRVRRNIFSTNIRGSKDAEIFK